MRPILMIPVLWLAGAATALAQPLKPAWERVEQGVADVGPLSVSQFVMPFDLRQPLGFESVYRLDRIDPFALPGTTDGMFARASGALTAVFPRSVYTNTRAGVVAEVPAGTIFYLGELPEELTGTPAKAPPLAFNRLDLSADLRAAAPATPGSAVGPGAAESVVQTGTAAAAEPRSMWTDDAYRARRIADLLRRAAEDPPRPPVRSAPGTGDSEAPERPGPR